MKKIIALTLVLVMALGLFAGCGNSADSKTITIGASPTPHAEILEIAKAELEKAGLSYEVMNVADHMDLVNEFAIQQAPTLIIRQNGEATKLVGASAIKKFSVDNKQ